MIAIKNPDGTHDLHLTSEEAGYLSTALLLARPRGTATAAAPSGAIRVHVHGEAAEPGPEHEPIEVR